MSQGTPDRAESIRQRLRNRVRAHGEDVQYALQRYAVERFLYRLGRSPHRDRFILKGAMLFGLWGGSIYRPTRDLDLIGQRLLMFVVPIWMTLADGRAFSDVWPPAGPWAAPAPVQEAAP